MNEERMPPHNLGAEQAVIGAVLIDNAQFDAVAEIIEAGDFYRESHRQIWTAMAALAAAKAPIDAVTLCEALRPQLAQIGGPAYIAECGQMAPGAALAVYYARIVREKAVQRGLVIAGTEIAARAYEAPMPWSPEWTEELVATAEYEIASVSSRLTRPAEAGKAELLSTALWRLDHQEGDALLTGFPTLDRDFAAFHPGHLTILAARTSKGKTALATNIALNLAHAGHGVAFFSLEMTVEEMWLRALGVEAQVSTFNIQRRGWRDDAERERVRAAESTLKALPLEILYRPSLRPRELRLECRRLAREMPLRLVVIDYMGLMRGDYHERDRWREMQEVIVALKRTAGELGLPIFVLAQINREPRDNERPSLAHLRDTGATEEHASNVMFIWPEPKNGAVPSYVEWEDVEILVAKQRNGPAPLTIPMQFRKSCGVFA